MPRWPRRPRRFLRLWRAWSRGRSRRHRCWLASSFFRPSECSPRWIRDTLRRGLQGSSIRSSQQRFDEIFESSRGCSGGSSCTGICSLMCITRSASSEGEFRVSLIVEETGRERNSCWSALVKSYKDSGGKQKKPHIAIVELKQPLPAWSAISRSLRNFSTSEGYPTEVVSPEQLEYRNGVLRHGDFVIDILYRRIRLSGIFGLSVSDLVVSCGARL